MVDFRQRDLWREQRERTRKESQKLHLPDLVKTVSMSLRGQATIQMALPLTTLGRENVSLVVDLNKYRAGRSLQAYLDAGVDRFIFRMGGPSQWVNGDYKYQQDQTYRPYMDQAAKLGILDLCGTYYIHNPFEEWRLEGIISNVHLGLINEWTMGGYMPSTCIICDHEIDKCYSSTGATITITSFNLINSLESTTAKVYNQWRKPSPIYSAAWFMNQYKDDHQNYFSNVNKPESLGGAGEQRPLWMAWYPQTFTKEYSSWNQVLDELLVPTASQEQALLCYGNYTRAKLWQFCYTIKLPGDTTGVDCSISLCSQTELDAAFGFKQATLPPEPEPTGEYLTIQTFENWKVNNYQVHTHQTLGPTL